MRKIWALSIFVLAVFAILVTCKDHDGGNTKTYTVVFDRNGGDTDANPSFVKAARDAAVKKMPAPPTREGYVFVEWNTKSEGDGLEFTAETIVTENITVYAKWREKESVAVKLDIHGNEGGDSVAISVGSSPGQNEIPNVEEGKTVTISYTLAAVKNNNRLVFSGVTPAIDSVTTTGSGAREYIVNIDDVEDGTITIKAVFTHTNKQFDNISFNENEINKIYGDDPFTIAISNRGSGTGAIIYSSGDPSVATINSASGEVTIHKAGHTTITAIKEEDDNYAEAAANDITLRIAQRQLTVSGTEVTKTKIYDGETTAVVTNVGTLTNKVGSDAVTVSAVAAYDSADAGTGKTINVTYSISGAQAGNYTAPVNHTVDDGVITKATGASLSGSIADGAEAAETSITIQPVTAPEGQTVEYAISTQNQMPTTGWQDGTTFSNLQSGTTYYIFARAKENGNYNTGTSVISGQFKTKETYTVSLAIHGNESGDSVTIKLGNNTANPITGVKVGDTITVSYTLAETKGKNQLAFSGVTGAIATVTTIGSGSWNYTVDSANVVEGTITITAAFTHTDKGIDTIAFAQSGNISKTYGEANFTRTATAASGTGTITYASSETSIATVNSISGEVTILKAGESTITATRAEDSNYAEVAASYILIIEKKQLTISGTAVTKTKTYNGNAAAVVTNNGTLSGVVSGDIVNLSTPTAAYNSKDVGTGKTITVTYSISGTHADNYTAPVDYTVNDGSITALQLTIGNPTVTKTKTYDGETTAAVTNVGTPTNRVSGDTVTVSATAAYNSKDVGTGKTITVTYSLGGAQAGNYTAPAAYSVNDGVINKLQLTIDAPSGTTSKTYDGTTTAAGITAGALTNRKGSDVVSVSVASAEYNSPDVVTGKTITVTYSDPSGAQAGNYTKPNNSTIYNASITKANGGTVTAPTLASKTHNSITINAVTAPSNGQTVEYGKNTTTADPTSWQTSTTFDDLTAGTNYYIFARSASNTNYNAGLAQRSALITTDAIYTVSLVITGNESGDSVSIKLGDDTANPITGAKAGDTITVTYTLANTKGKNRLDFTGVAIDSVTTTGNGTKSYTVNSADAANGTITINAEFTHTNKGIDPIAFTNANVTRTYGDANFTNAAATTSGTGAITYTSSDTSVATVSSSGEVKIEKAGESTITAKRAEDTDYAEAVASYNLEVGKRQLTINNPTVTATKTYDGSTTAVVTAGSLTNKVGDDAVTASATAAYNSKDVGTGKTITVAYTISGTDAGNYTAPVNSTVTNGVITAKQLTISAPTGTTKEYDRSTNATGITAGTLSGVVSGDTVTVSVSSATYNSNSVGTSKTITIGYAISGTDAGNYTAPVNSTVNGVITAKQLTIGNPTGTTTKEYDRNTTLPTSNITAGTLSGVLSGDTVTVSVSGATYNSNSVGTGKTVTVAYTLGGGQAGNYAKPADSTMNNGVITAKKLTVSGTVVTKTKAYDNSTTAAVTTNGTLSGIISGDTVTLSTPTAVYNSKDVASANKITVTYAIDGASATNYTKPDNLDITDGVSITKKQLTIGNPTLTTTKQYDSTTTATVTPGTLSGQVNNETVTVNASAAYDSNSIGTGKTITVTYAISGNASGNYTAPAVYTVTNGAITAKQLTVSGTTVTTTKTYDGNTNAAVTANGTLSGKVGSETVNLNTVTAAYNSADAGTNKTITIAYTINGANESNYTAPASATQTGTINKATGGTVTAPTVSGTPTTTSITVNTVSAPSGQTVEYGISTSSTANPTSWQTGTTFTGLTANTNYYVSARSADNTNYNAGTPQKSAAIRTATGGSGGNPTVPPVIVDFESDATGSTTKYTFTKGGSSPTISIVSTPAQGTKALRVVASGYNQAAIIPITIPYTLENWANVTLKLYISSGTLSDTNVRVYAASSASAFVEHGFGNPADSQYPQFAANLVGTATVTNTTGSWQNLSISITNPSSAIQNIRNTIYLAIGVNQSDSITYQLDDITFNIKSNFTPPPAPITPNPPSVGAVTSGNYRNLFQEFGKTSTEITAKINKYWNQLFVNGNSNEKIFVEVGNDMAYIYTADTNDVRSEGMSYGMMMCVQMDDQTRFNKLWKWAHTYMYNDRTKKVDDIRGYFSWQCRTDGSKIDPGVAPDGEFYFITALLFAENRWGNGNGINEYGRWARYILYDMIHRDPGGLDNWGASTMFNTSNYLPLFTTNGAGTGGAAGHTDPSYILPAFYDVWAIEIENGTQYHNDIWGGSAAAMTDAQFYRNAATAGRAFFPTTVNPTTGLGPDYADFNGAPRGGNHAQFEYDAWRIALNIGMDYHWWAKDQWQKTQSDRIQSFFHSKGVDSYGSLWNLDGTVRNNNTDHSPGLVACNAVASLAATQAIAWDFIENFWDISTTTGQYRYYDGCLYMMGLLHVTGNFKAYLSTGGGSTNPYISPTSATFNKYTSSADYKDIAVTMTLNGSTLSSISGGSPAITSGNYTVSNSTVTIKTAYLAQQSVGTTTLTFTFANGTTRTLSIDIVNTAPTPTITPTTATFDKKTGAQADVVVTMTLYTYTLSNIKNGNATLTSGSNYTTSGSNGSTVTIKAAYLAGLANGNTTLTFTFSDGTTRNIVITIGDTTGGGTIGGGTEYNFANGANPSVTSSSNVNVTIENGVLRVNRPGGYGSASQVMIPFNLGGSTLGSFTKLQLVVKCNGDYQNKGIVVAASSDGSTWTNIATTSTNVNSSNDWTTNFKTVTINISGASALSGAIMIRLQWESSNPVTYEFQSIGLTN